MFGQRLVLGHETAQVDDASRTGIPGRGCDVGRRGIVGVAKAGLTDPVHQVIDHVDRTRDVPGQGKRALRRHRIRRVEFDRYDIVEPTETLEAGRVSGRGRDLVTFRQQRGDQARTNIAGSTGYQNPHTLT